MVIEKIDLLRISDGAYRGEFSYSKSTYAVKVTVENHKIKNIEVLQNGTSGYAKKAEGILSKVIDEQSLQVDAVSGSTTTSKSLLKATENAQKKGLK